MVPHRGYWPVPRRISGVQRFGWVLLVALVLVLVALVVALVVVVLPGDGDDLDAEGGANGSSNSVAEVADSFAEKRPAGLSDLGSAGGDERRCGVSGGAVCGGAHCQ